MLPSMPILFSTSQQSFVGEANSEDAERPTCSGMSYDGKEGSEDELVLNSAAADRRKILCSQLKNKKKRPDSSEDRHSDDDSATHYAESYFSKAKSLLDENTFQKFIALLAQTVDEPGSVNSLFNQLTELLAGYPELIDDFIGFLKPHQALQAGRLSDLNFFTNCWDFFKKLEGHQISRVVHAVEQQCSNPNVSSEGVKAGVTSLLKGHNQLSETFLRLLPDERPLPCPKEDYEDISETPIEEGAWERLRIPEHQDRGCTLDCSCRCHSTPSQPFCIACNIRFINGQAFVQYGKVLRYARLHFGDTPPDKILQTLHPALYSKRRRKRKAKVTAQNHKDAEEVLCEDDNAIQSKEDIRPLSPTGPEDKTEEEDDYWEEDDVASDKSSGAEMSLEDMDDTSDSIKFIGQLSDPLSPLGSTLNEEVVIPPPTNEEVKDNVEEVNKCEPAPPPPPPSDDELKVWTREEDKMILQAFQKEIGTDETFCRISNLMPSRSVKDIQGRFQVLMNLLEKVASCSHENYPT